MAKLFRNAMIILAVLLVFGQAIFPMEQRLRKGKDLAGGVTITFAVAMSAGDDRKAVLDRTVEVLKQRIDPNGVMEISIVPQGDDRIEITMPLPTPEVKKLRQEYEDALAAMGRNAVTSSRVDRAMQASGADRAARIKEMASGNAEREGALTRAAESFDRAALLRLELAALSEDAAREAKAAEVAQAEIAYETARDEVLKSVVSAGELRRVLQLSTRRQTLENPETGQKEQIPSPREQALERLKATHPGAAGEIDAIVAKHDRYAANRRTLDDPYELAALVRGAGVFTFRITCEPGEHRDEAALRQALHERGPRNARAEDARWFKINDISGWYHDVSQLRALRANPARFFAGMKYVVEEYDGEYYMLAWDTRSTRLTRAEGEWAVARAAPGVDRRGLPSINFEMDPRGARLLAELTSQHNQKHMAVLLDDEVYTAPNLNSTISQSGEIYGEFQQRDIDYIVRVLTAGSLKGKLSEPLSIDSIGPELGADNLRQGLKAGLVAVVTIAAFMVVYYFGAGVVSVFALSMTGILILGAMAMQHAAFTMAGIAGVVLTFGMAVDSNVLIYERMREELVNGADLRTAVRLGFDKALASIVDGNITTLIVCVVLALKQISTPEIRGFGITMGIGIVATLFSALFVSRFCFDVLLDVVKIRHMSMLPLKVKWIQRLLTPNVDWIGLRGIFFTLSTVYVALGLAMAVSRGGNMLDTQFRGGAAITLDFKRGADGERLTMERKDVEARVRAIAAGRSPTDPLAKLEKAGVSPINPREDGVTAERFKVTTLSKDPQEQAALVEAVVEKFADKLEVRPALTFKGSDVAEAKVAPVYVVEKPGPLGPNIGMSGVSATTTAYVGGVAVVLEDLRPAPSLEELRDRLERARQTADFSDTLSRKREIVVIDGDDAAVRSAALVVRDETVGAFDDPRRFDDDVRAREWALVREALVTKRSPASVQTIGPAIAEDFLVRAIIATIVSFIGIGIYIWVRFKSLRYSLAAIVALVHDVLTVLGLAAVSAWLVENPSTQQWATRLGLMAFKIDFNMVAALLTVAGYSLNDTVIIMDRIRENRGKAKSASRGMINNAINHTISRTIITSGTVIVTAIILYMFGGEGVRAFSFALLMGVVVGTYSSVAVASPIVWSRKTDMEEVVAVARTA